MVNDVVEIPESVVDMQYELIMNVDHIDFIIPQEFQELYCYSYVLQFLEVDVKLCGFLYVLFIILNFYKTRGRVFMNKYSVMISYGHGFSPINLYAMIRG